MADTTDEKWKKVADFFKSYWGEAFIYILITAGGSLMPVWGGILLYKLFSLYLDFSVFVDDGQFYLFSAAFFTPSCYQLYKNKSNNNLFHSVIFLLSIFLLVASAILFAGISIFDLPSVETSTVQLKIDKYFLRYSSLILFSFSLTTAFISQAIENKYRTGGPGVGELSDARENVVSALNQQFDKLEGENG